MDWNPQLSLAEEYLTRTGVSVFLTGKAGTGKTTFLRHIANTISKRYVIVAPTGVAAINAGGVTIHSMFQLPTCPYLPDVKELVNEYNMPEYRQRLRKNKINILRTLELLIIDEISMVRADLLDAIDNTLRHYRRSSRPFGGVQLLMIGDLHQLPPVVTDDERRYIEQVYPSPFFFCSKALCKTQFVTIELTTIYRQQDERFVNLLNNIRDNKFDAATLEVLNRRYIKDFDGDGIHEYIRLTTHNYQADSVNRLRMDALDTEAVTIEAVVNGKFPESSMPVDRALTLKQGEQVMFVKNDSEPAHAYYNGKIGTIESIVEGDDGFVITVRDQDGNLITAHRETWENLRYEIDKSDNKIKQYVDGSFEQYPLRPAWAITIHKAQGLTFDYVIIDAASAFSYGQVYVALSRCRSYEGMVLSTPIGIGGAISSHDIDAFNSTQPSERQVRESLDVYETIYFYDNANELFDVSVMERNLDKIVGIFSERLAAVYPRQREHLLSLRDSMVSLSEVTSKFRNQLSRLTVANAPTSDVVQQRLRSAAEYYYGQLAPLAEAMDVVMNLEIDSKQTLSDLAEPFSVLDEALFVRLKVLKHVAAKGFDVADYQRIKADAMLAKDGADSGAKETTHRQTGHGRPSGLDSQNPKLLAALVKWRKAKADERQVEAYMVMQQKTLRAIADAAPTTLRELQKVEGMGKKRVSDFGEEIIAIVKKMKKASS